MNVMIDLKTLFLIVLGIALLVLIVYLIQLTRKLLTSMDHTINILEDVATITDLAAKRSKDVDGIIGDVSESVESLSKAVKGDQKYFLCDLFCNKSGRSCEEGWFEGVDANRKSPQGGQVRLLVKGMKGV